jgi:hypothetical protein
MKIDDGEGDTTRNCIPFTRIQLSRISVRLRLAGNVVRINGNEPPKIITSNPGGRRGRGGPELRWIDGVEEDASRLGCRT